MDAHEEMIASQLGDEPLISPSALNAGLGDNFDPMSHDELHDKGPWVASEKGRTIDSDDFTHDVYLLVCGDFYNDEQRKAYADNLAKKLNTPTYKLSGSGTESALNAGFGMECGKWRLAITPEQYEAAIPKCCAYQTLEAHENMLLCWGLISSLEHDYQINCNGCDLNTMKSSEVPNGGINGRAEGASL